MEVVHPRAPDDALTGEAVEAATPVPAVGYDGRRDLPCNRALLVEGGLARVDGQVVVESSPGSLARERMPLLGSDRALWAHPHGHWRQLSAPAERGRLGCCSLDWLFAVARGSCPGG